MTAVLSEETKARDEIISVGRSLFERCLSPGSTGNISVRLTSGDLLMTPTNASLGSLEAAKISKLSAQGIHLGGDKPTKEAYLHQCVYCKCASARAIVHLHSTHAVAVTLLPEIDRANVLPPLTAYYAMRVGRLPLVDYFPPGDSALAAAVGAKIGGARAVLLANHGPVVSGETLLEAQYASEELEETAKIYLMVRGGAFRTLTDEQSERLAKR
jgi:ribulose-5-phosphate 4-epimerase/fuculose-1-phosphate aldolase